MNITFPPDFDIEYYKRTYPELLGLPEEVVREHYRRYAEERGLSVCLYDKSEKLRGIMAQIVNETDAKILEIGPYDYPACIGEHVKYFDIHDSVTLKELALKEGRNKKNTPAKIDYVEPHGDLSIVKETFNIVFSSHCIEHQPDLVRHLKNVENILEENGLYILVIPDHRYCFDHFRKASTLYEIIEAYFEKRTHHTFKSVMEYNCVHAHNNSILHWVGNHGENKLDEEKFRKTYELYEKSLAADEYVDAHAWCLTPKTFVEIITDLNKLGMINFEIERHCHTVWGRFEFVVILKKISAR